MIIKDLTFVRNTQDKKTFPEFYTNIQREPFKIKTNFGKTGKFTNFSEFKSLFNNYDQTIAMSDNSDPVGKSSLPTNIVCVSKIDVKFDLYVVRVYESNISDLKIDEKSLNNIKLNVTYTVSNYIIYYLYIYYCIIPSIIDPNLRRKECKIFKRIISNFDKYYDIIHKIITDYIDSDKDNGHDNDHGKGQTTFWGTDRYESFFKNDNRVNSFITLKYNELRSVIQKTGKDNYNKLFVFSTTTVRSITTKKISNNIKDNIPFSHINNGGKRKTRKNRKLKIKQPSRRG
jgi:hypothetical protein